jgi:hypothetical protein
MTGGEFLTLTGLPPRGLALLAAKGAPAEVAP